MKYLSILLLVVTCLTFHSVQAEQKFPIGLDKPFKVLYFPDEWEILEANKKMLLCEHKDNNKVNFDLAVGKKLSSKETLDNLEQQIKDYIDGKSKTVEIIANSLEFDAEEDEEENESAPKLENAQVEREIINGIEWIKVRGDTVLYVTHSISNGEEWSEELPLTQLSYCTIWNKRVIFVDFDALTEDFETYLPLFITTMNNLYR